MNDKTKKDLTHWGLAILFVWLFSLLPPKIRAAILLFGFGYLVGFWIYVLFFHTNS